MAGYIDTKHNDLMVRCDSCGKTEKVYHNQTDITLVNQWMNDNSWKWVKITGIWQSICPECKTQLEERKRQSWLDKAVK